MRAAKTEQTAGIGSNEVAANFERIGWGPVANPYHDLGTDLLVAVRDERLFDLGLIVGVQVKAGPSYFKEPHASDDGTISGWWYYEKDVRHFDDWVTHGLPHILVLHDLDSRTSYWVHVTASSVTSTGQGAKVLVPAAHVLGASNLEALIGVATTGRTPLELQGSAWSAGASSIPPARRLRHALLLPRLVAPHRNAGFDRALEPEEGLALVSQARLSDFAQFAEKYGDVPAVGDASLSKDWRWRLVAALAQALLGVDRAAVALLVTEAPSPAARAAAAVVAAALLIEDGEPSKAVDLLSDVCVTRDDLSPVDLGWALVQRARARAEIGDTEGAREDAIAARKSVVADVGDPTASVIAGSAAMLLFRSAAWGSSDVADVVAATDTAGSWWRTQTLAGAVLAAVDQQFKSWTHDSAVTFASEDSVNNPLVSAAFNANVAADHSAWCSTLATHGRLLLMSAEAGDSDQLESGLTELRRAGDAKAVGLTATHLWRNGPTAILTKALEEAAPSTLSRTTAHATLTLWEKAGDAAGAESAARTALFLLDVLIDPMPFAERVSPHFLVRPAASDALAGLVLAAAPAHAAIVSQLAELDEVQDELLAMGLARVAGRLPEEAITENDRAGLHGAAMSQSKGSLAAALLNLAGDQESLAELVRRVEEGDTQALANLNVTLLSEQGAEALINRFAESVRQCIRDAQRGMYGGPVIDPAEALVVLNANFTGVARWDPVLELIASHAVPGSYKRGAVTKLVAVRDSIPSEVRRDILGLAIAGVPDADPLGGILGGVKLAGAALSLRVALGDREDMERVLVRLLHGPASHRADAAHLLGLSGQPKDIGVLAALASDKEIDVREAAARAVGYVFASIGRADGLLANVAGQLAADQGAAAPRALLAGILSAETRCRDAAELAGGLLDHPSAAVRHTARNVTSGSSEMSV